MKPQILNRILKTEEIPHYLSLLCAAEEGMKYILCGSGGIFQGSIPSNLVSLARQNADAGLYCFHYVNANAEISPIDGAINYSDQEKRVKMGFVYLYLTKKEKCTLPNT